MSMKPQDPAAARQRHLSLMRDINNRRYKEDPEYRARLLQTTGRGQNVRRFCKFIGEIDWSAPGNPYDPSKPGPLKGRGRPPRTAA